MKLLVIGLDGLSPDLFRRMAIRQTLPIKSLDIEVAMSGPSWTTMYTGLSILEHGVTEVLGRPLKVLGTMSKTYADLKGKMVWDRLATKGFRSILCNLPCASPVREINGVHVGGCPIDPRAFTWPTYMPEVPLRWAQMCDLNHFGTYLGQGRWHDDWPQNVEYQLQGALNIFEYIRLSSIEMAEWFATRARFFDFGWITFTYIDRMAHIWGLTKTVLGTCGVVTHAIMDVLFHLHPENLLIVSDHGFSRPVENVDIGTHTRVGMLVADGDIRNLTDDRDGWRNLDVAPLILRAFGIRSPFPASTPIATNIMGRRLEALGYVSDAETVATLEA